MRITAILGTTPSSSRMPSPRRKRMGDAHLAHAIIILLAASLLVDSSLGFSIGSRCSHARRVPSFDTSLYKTKQPPSLSLHAKKRTNNNSDENNDDDARNVNIMGIFKKSPGVAIVAPFVFLFGLDLILNIAVLTKRSLEVFFTGEYTVWTPWQ